MFATASHGCLIFDGVCSCVCFTSVCIKIYKPSDRDCTVSVSCVCCMAVLVMHIMNIVLNIVNIY